MFWLNRFLILIKIFGLGLFNAFEPGGTLVKRLAWVILDNFDLLRWKTFVQIKDAVGIVRVEKEFARIKSC